MFKKGPNKSRKTLSLWKAIIEGRQEGKKGKEGKEGKKEGRRKGRG